MTASVTLIAVLHQYESFSDISKKKFSVLVLTQIHKHQLKALLLKSRIYQQKKIQKVPIMLTCMNSKNEFHHLNYQMTGKYLTSKTIFSKKSNFYEISSIDIYVGKDLEFIIRVFSWSIPLDHEIYAKYKKQ